MSSYAILGASRGIGLEFARQLVRCQSFRERDAVPLLNLHVGSQVGYDGLRHCPQRERVEILGRGRLW